MSVFGAAIITFFAMLMVTWHLDRATCRKLAGYALWIDLTIHIGVIVLFLGTSTLGLMQAELSAIFITLTIRAYRYAFGYSRLARRGPRLVWNTTKGRIA